MFNKGDKITFYNDDKKLNPCAEKITMKKSKEITIMIQPKGGVVLYEVIQYKQIRICILSKNNMQIFC